MEVTAKNGAKTTLSSVEGALEVCLHYFMIFKDKYDTCRNNYNNNISVFALLQIKFHCSTTVVPNRFSFTYP